MLKKESCFLDGGIRINKVLENVPMCCQSTGSTRSSQSTIDGKMPLVVMRGWTTVGVRLLLLVTVGSRTAYA